MTADAPNALSTLVDNFGDESAEDHAARVPGVALRALNGA